MGRASDYLPPTQPIRYPLTPPAFPVPPLMPLDLPGAPLLPQPGAPVLPWRPPHPDRMVG